MIGNEVEEWAVSVGEQSGGDWPMVVVVVEKDGRAYFRAEVDGEALRQELATMPASGQRYDLKALAGAVGVGASIIETLAQQLKSGTLQASVDGPDRDAQSN